LLGALCAAFLSSAPGAQAGVANAGLPGAPRANPLASMRWGYDSSVHNSPYVAYSRASGTDRDLLAKIALRPTVAWFGSWDPDASAGATIHAYITAVTGGNPDVLAQLTVFRFDPWEGAACHAAPNSAAQASYRRWVDSAAAGIGDSRVALILQPDLPFAECSPGRGAWLGLAAYASRVFSALPHTTVYIDAGARYWPPIRQTAGMLQAAGVRYARGFSLNDTAYDSTGAELSLGASIVSRLNAIGIRGKHFVISTAQNGAPFLNGQYHGDISNPRVCAGGHDRLCATLGIPPTWHTSDRRWHLSRGGRGIASRYADAYLWVGRPWLDYGSNPFDLQRALGLARSTPF
jgi:endoglucanase